MTKLDASPRGSVHLSYIHVDGNVCTSIQSAIAQAILQGGVQVICIGPGLYQENLDFTGATNITLLGMVALGDEGQCEIMGKHIPPQNGSLVIRNIKLTSANDIFYSNAVGASHITLVDCYLNVANGYTFNLPNWKGIFELFDINEGTQNDGGIFNLGGATTYVYSAGIGIGSQNIMTLSGLTIFNAATVGCPILSKGTAEIVSNASVYGGTLTFEGYSSGSFCADCFYTETAPSIVQNSVNSLVLTNTTIRSTANPVIQGSGSGALELVSVSFSEGSGIANTLQKKHSGFHETSTLLANNLSFDRGQTTLSTNGALIIGDANNNPKINTLTAGTGIEITNKPGSIAIASKGQFRQSATTLSQEKQNLIAIPIERNRAVTIKALVSGYDPNGSSICGGEITAVFFNKDGQVFSVGSPHKNISQSNRCLASFDLVNNGSNVQLYVTGEKGIKMQWHAVANVVGID